MPSRTNMKRRCPPGLGGTPTYRSWYGMLERCNNPKAKSWEYYGGRGISVCPEWHYLDSFVSDMGLRPAGMSIDRINPDGNYEPGNCRWSTELTQQRNRRSTKLNEGIAERIRSDEFLGKTQKQIGEILDIDPSVISRIRTGAIWRVQH